MVEDCLLHPLTRRRRKTIAPNIEIIKMKCFGKSDRVVLMDVLMAVFFVTDPFTHNWMIIILQHFLWYIAW